MIATYLIVITFIVYRLSVMIAEDVGPLRSFERLRCFFPAGSEWHDGIRCVGCVGVWVAAAIAFGFVAFSNVTLFHGTAMWLATAGGAMFLNRIAPCPK